MFHYDISLQLLGEADATGSPVKDYVWLGSEPVAQIESTGVVVYLHTDHLLTPRLGTSDAKSIVWRWEGEAFGDVEAQGPVEVNLRFPGQYFDLETGRLYNWHRYYDQGTGRYAQSDLIGLLGGLNTYAYVGGNPIRGLDPLGLATAVINNGPTAGNPFGHTAVAVTGSGIYSYGNGTALGGSFTGYLLRESPRRNTDVIIINTTPQQEEKILSYLQGTKDDLPPWILGRIPDPTDTCSVRTNNALERAGLVDPYTIGPSFPTDVAAQAEVWRQTLGGSVISIPKNSTIIPSILNQFNKRP